MTRLERNFLGGCFLENSDPHQEIYKDLDISHRILNSNPCVGKNIYRGSCGYSIILLTRYYVCTNESSHVGGITSSR